MKVLHNGSAVLMTAPDDAIITGSRFHHRQFIDGWPPGVEVGQSDPVDPGEPEYDPSTQRVERGWLWADGVLTRTYTLVALPPAPEPPPPDPRALTKLEFARLLAGPGGMTMAGVRAARDDAALADLWFVVDLATAVERGDPDTLAGLDAMVSLGHLTEAGKTEVLAQWPVVS